VKAASRGNRAERVIRRKLPDTLRCVFRPSSPAPCYALMQAVGMVNDHTTDGF